MNTTPEPPYELHTHGGGAFVIFNVGDQIALPLFSLARATLRARSVGDVLALEFQSVEVLIEGRALSALVDHLLAGRVRRISCARDNSCEVANIQVKDAS